MRVCVTQSWAQNVPTKERKEENKKKKKLDENEDAKNVFLAILRLFLTKSVGLNFQQLPSSPQFAIT